MRSWLDDLPERAEHEIRALSALGFQVDEFELATNRRLAMRGTRSTSRGELGLVVVFPDSFPYLRPEVFLSDVALERHQNPYEGNLCLLDRSSRAWDVDQTGAWLVEERVPYLFDLLADGGKRLAEGETPQGEPRSAYFRAQAGTVVFVPSEALVMDPDERHGQIELWYGRAEPPTIALRALLRTVTAKGGSHGRLLASADEHLANRFGNRKIDARWVRLSALPDENSPEALLRAAIVALPELSKPRFVPVADGEIAVIGVVFREEVRQHVWEDGWLFVVLHRHRTGKAQQREGAFIVRGERLSPADLGERIPRLATLPVRHVALIGLGALGAPIALELARSGIGTLSILDCDRVEVGNSVRWPLGLTAVGHDKTDVIRGWIANEYPYTEVRALAGRLGDTGTPALLGTPRTHSELDALDDLVAEADLIIDASAEVGVQHLVSSIAGARPTLYVWATEGAAGGAVVRAVSAGGCWLCLQHSLDDGSVPLPTSERGATTQPRGCAAPTFTGASYDLAPIAMQAVRVAVATLTGDDSVDDVSIASMRDAAGRARPCPEWYCAPLEVHPSCEVCRSARVAA